MKDRKSYTSSILWQKTAQKLSTVQNRRSREVRRSWEVRRGREVRRSWEVRRGREVRRSRKARRSQQPHRCNPAGYPPRCLNIPKCETSQTSYTLAKEYASIIECLYLLDINQLWNTGASIAGCLAKLLVMIGTALLRYQKHLLKPLTLMISGCPCLFMSWSATPTHADHQHRSGSMSLPGSHPPDAS